MVVANQPVGSGGSRLISCLMGGAAGDNLKLNSVLYVRTRFPAVREFPH